MLTTAKKATCHTFLCALAFVSVADAQVVEKGRTFDDLTASHPCASGLENRIARVTDCDAADDFGDGGGAFQCWAYCDGSAPWTNLAIGGGGGGGIDGTLTATDNLIVRTDGTGGSTIQASPLTLSDVSGVTTTLATITPAATTGASVAGQSLVIAASPAVASTDTAGAADGGSVTIMAGSAARNTSGNAVGGNIVLNHGTSTPGSPPAIVQVGSENGTGFGFYTSGGIMQTIQGNNWLWMTTAGLKVRNDSGLLWASVNYADGTLDTGLKRYAAGVVKATDGSTGIRGFLGGGAAVASATAMPVPTGRVFHVTGTTTITSITSTNFQSGACVSLIFDDVLTFTDGSNLKLAGNFVTTADDTISLCYDGTNWYETGRSVN